MKEVKAAQKEQKEVLDCIKKRISYYDDILSLKKEGGFTEKSGLKFKREALYQEIWEITPTKVAKKYGLSYNKLKAACAEANIPLPTQSYWGNLQAGNPVQKPPLPESSESELIIELPYQRRMIDSVDCLEKQTKKSAEIASIQPSDQNQPSESKVPDATVVRDIDLLNFLPEDERDQVVSMALSLHVDLKGKKLHPVFQKHKAAFSAWAKQHPRDPYANWKHDPYRFVDKDEPALWECVSEERLPRIYHFLDPLFRAVEKLGGKVFDDLSLQVRNEHVYLWIMEGRDQTTHVLTKDEQREMERYEREKRQGGYTYEPHFRKYDYIPNGKLRISAFWKSFIRDSANTGIETRIGDILIALYLQSEDRKIEREKKEEERRKAEEEKRQKELRIQKYNDEIDKLQKLNHEAADFETACRIRAYVSAVELKPDLDTETKEWITWAKAKADWYDPTISAIDPILGKRNHDEDSKNKEPVKKGFYPWNY